MTLVQLASLALGAILVENFVLVRFLGCCSFLGVSEKTDTALGMGIAVTFVMALSSAFIYPVYTYLLVPLKLEYLQTVSYVLIIAALVQFVELFLKKSVPVLYRALGIYLPLITTNCAVLGAVLINARSGYNFIGSFVFGTCAGIGYTLAIMLFSGVRERLKFSDCPRSFEGFPIALISTSLLAMAFMGFSGLKVW